MASSNTRDIWRFVSTHTEPSPNIDPSTVKLPSPFVVCVVGASRGIGAGIALAYAHAGASGLILASRRVPGLEETAARCRAVNPQIKIEVVACDITSTEAMQVLAGRIQLLFGRLDIAVVNSGYSGPVVLKITETDPQTFSNAINVNYTGTFLCAKYLIPLLLGTDDGAKAFIGVSSLAALIVNGPIANAQYCASKTAQLKLLEHIHEQYHEEGLKAFAIHPGAVLSEMARDTAPPHILDMLKDSVDLCGAFCTWLTKDDKSWLSGRLLCANWDVEELQARKEEIVEKDLLKLKLSFP